MSKRVSLTDFEIEQIVNALDPLSKEPSYTYQVTVCGQDFYAKLIEKLQKAKA